MSPACRYHGADWIIEGASGYFYCERCDNREQIESAEAFEESRREEEEMENAEEAGNANADKTAQG